MQEEILNKLKKCTSNTDTPLVYVSVSVFRHLVVQVSTMAEGGDVEWELSKENIQPLRRGRAISALHQALSQQQDGLSSAINQQRQYG